MLSPRGDHQGVCARLRFAVTEGDPMAFLKLLFAPVRRVLGFPLVQLVIAIIVILLLQAADSKSLPGEIFSALDLLVDHSVRLLAGLFEVRSFTRAWMTTGFMIAYVYLAGLLVLFLARAAIAAMIEFMARHNAFGLTNTIARERGIAAYRAWLPLERIRPPHVAQDIWEERFAWPADNRPPYPPLWRRVMRAVLTYTLVLAAVAALFQAFTPFPLLTWVGNALTRLR
jgi:hypothetical protein